MAHEEWLELADVYAAGALDGEELSRFEYHLTVCPPCREYVIEIEVVLAEFPKALEPCFPSPEVKKCLLEKISDEARPEWQRPRSHRPAMAMVSGALALCSLIVVLTVGITNTRQKLLQFE